MSQESAELPPSLTRALRNSFFLIHRHTRRPPAHQHDRRCHLSEEKFVNENDNFSVTLVVLSDVENDVDDSESGSEEK